MHLTLRGGLNIYGVSLFIQHEVSFTNEWLALNHDLIFQYLEHIIFIKINSISEHFNVINTCYCVIIDMY